MVCAFNVGAVAERVVVAPDLGEGLAGEGFGEVVEEFEGVCGGLVAEFVGYEEVREVHGRTSAMACSRYSAVTR